MIEVDYLLIWLALALFIVALILSVASAVLREDDEALNGRIPDELITPMSDPIEVPVAQRTAWFRQDWRRSRPGSGALAQAQFSVLPNAIAHKGPHEYQGTPTPHGIGDKTEHHTRQYVAAGPVALERANDEQGRGS